MRIMSSIQRAILVQVPIHQGLCTFSYLRKTYSLLQMQQTHTPASSLRCLHNLHSAKSRSPRTSSMKPMMVGFCLEHGCKSSSSWTKPSRHISCGMNYLDESKEESRTEGESNNIPKREGELLKFTNHLRSPKQRFVLTSSLARTIRERIWPGESLKEETATIITANEGPGFMSRELLENGAGNVLGLCRHERFCPVLEEIQQEAPDRFKWQQADIYQMQYIGDRVTRPPIARVEDVFQDIESTAWEEDIGVKVVGALPQDSERKQAYVLASLILERLSMFSYGRVQLNLFMSKNCYNTLIHPPGNMKSYRALSALYQVSSDIQLLHHEPVVSFKLPRKTPRKSSDVEKKLEDLLLVQITPKRDLFSRHQMEQWEAFIFVFFVRQALARRSERLEKIIEAWAPGSADVISEFGFTRKTKTGDVCGDDLLAIFCRICKLDNFNGAWMGEEVMGWASGRHQDMNTMELSQALGTVHLP
uniref:rRNA adenine N(6)-methyltransferase n=1 Tax=Paracentrotus lividus TaxID=7656 RepID=U3KUX5_PARLI|nr:mitochondrial transcription factor 2M [Paracentrotus lividus]